MHIFNRILVILGLLLVMVMSAIVFIAPAPFFTIFITFLQQTDASLTALTGSSLILRWAGGFIFTLLVWAICVALLWLEVRRPRSRTIVVQKVSGGLAELTGDSIISRLEYNLDQLAEIINARATVRSGRKGVRIDLAVETSPEVEVPSKSEQIQQVTRDIVESQMGLQLESMRVVMRHAPYPKSYFKGRKIEPAARPPVIAGAEGAARPVTAAQSGSPEYPRAAPRPEAAVTQEPVTPPARWPRPSALPEATSQPEATLRPKATVEPALQPEAALQPEDGTHPPAGDEQGKAPWRPWSFLRPRDAEQAEDGAEPEAAAKAEAAPGTEAATQAKLAAEPISELDSDETRPVGSADEETPEDRHFS